jgi:hypothetical protein
MAERFDASERATRSTKERKYPDAPRDDLRPLLGHARRFDRAERDLEVPVVVGVERVQLRLVDTRERPEQRLADLGNANAYTYET